MRGNLFTHNITSHDVLKSRFGSHGEEGKSGIASWHLMKPTFVFLKSLYLPQFIFHWFPLLRNKYPSNVSVDVSLVTARVSRLRNFVFNFLHLLWHWFDSYAFPNLPEQMFKLKDALLRSALSSKWRLCHTLCYKRDITHCLNRESWIFKKKHVA